MAAARLPPAATLDMAPELDQRIAVAAAVLLYVLVYARSQQMWFWSDEASSRVHEGAPFYGAGMHLLGLL